MWRRVLLGIVGLAACTASRVERQQLADGSWKVTCPLPMDACVRNFEIVCPDKRYRILGGQSQRELRDVEPIVREYQSSELIAICNPRSAAAPAPQAAPAGSVTPPTAAPAPICAPGSTQGCVGPGGCSGGQACRPDGAGYAACDCGPSRAFVADAGSG